MLIGDFNINLIMQDTGDQRSLKKLPITNTQSINLYTTDYRTQIDHIYTMYCNLRNFQVL